VDDYSELASDDVPALIRGEAVDPASLGGPGAELSTGLALAWHRHLVFGTGQGARDPADRRPEENRSFVAIGGHLEPGEGWYAAVQREAREEAGCKIALGDSPVTYLCRDGYVPQPIALQWYEEYRPLLIWIATLSLPREPQHALRSVTMVTAVFRAAALSRPHPSGEHTSLLMLDWDVLREVYSRPLMWADLRARGALIIGQEPLPETTLVAHGSAHFLGQ
jgi:8-oxo-dGTP pyrophosphatase MutT (NUDIX family)